MSVVSLTIGGYTNGARQVPVGFDDANEINDVIERVALHVIKALRKTKSLLHFKEKNMIW